MCKVCLYNNIVSKDFLNTPILEIESIINLKYMTYVDDDKGVIVLRPFLFLSNNSPL